MESEQLAELIQQGGNDELLTLLWEKTRALIYMKCSQYWGFYSAKLERFGYSLDDLRQESYNALIFAVKQYKSDKEYKLITYLNYALKNVIRGLLKGENDALNRLDTQSLEQPLGESSDGDPLLVGDTVLDERAAAVFEEIERRNGYTVLYEAIDCLPPDLREVIREHYFEGLTFKQIGERLGLSRDQARQLHNKALKELRNNRALRAFCGS